MSSLVVPGVEEIGGMSPADLEARIRGLDVERRRVDAQIAVLVNRVEVSGAFLSDHHRTVRAWSKAACNWSGAEAFQFQQVGRMLARFPTAAVAAAAGRLGVAQMRVLAAVVANPRLKGVLDPGEDHLVGVGGHVVC